MGVVKDRGVREEVLQSIVAEKEEKKGRTSQFVFRMVMRERI